MNKKELGSLGLPFRECGAVVQAMAEVLVDRGHDEDDVRDRLTNGDFDEEGFWNVLAPIVDELAKDLGLPAYPEEEEA